MIVEQIISDISKGLAIDSANLTTAVRNCEAMGKLSIPELRQLSNMGVPVVSIIASVKRISELDGFNKVKDGEITYSDLVCVLGIFAQDCLVEFQRKRINKYNG